MTCLIFPFCPRLHVSLGPTGAAAAVSDVRVPAATPRAEIAAIRATAPRLRVNGLIRFAPSGRDFGGNLPPSAPAPGYPLVKPGWRTVVTVEAARYVNETAC